MPKVKDALTLFDSGYCTWKRCRKFLANGAGLQDFTDPANPQRYCWECADKAEAARVSVPVPKQEPAPRRIVVVRKVIR